MKKIFAIMICLVAFNKSDAQIPVVSVITGAVKKVINALDLQVQRLQNKTIFLQNAQKVLENEMSKLKLDEISGWVEKQRQLYEEYYDELWRVKQIISDYDKVREIISMQGRIFNEYKTAYGLFQKDGHFTPQEIQYMYKVYSGMIDASLKNAEQLLLVVNGFVTQMDDAARINIIDNAFFNMKKTYSDLKQFNNQNIQLSLQRAAGDDDVESVKKLYGL